MKLFALFLTINLALLAADPTPEELREAGFAALKAAQASPSDPPSRVENTVRTVVGSLNVTTNGVLFLMFV